MNQVPRSIAEAEPEQYAIAIAAGASPEQIEEVYKLAPYICDTIGAYADAINHGVAHNQVLEAFESVGDLGGYVEALYSGATHEECIECGDAEVIISDYARLRRRGWIHKAALADADKCGEE
jgi:hypothetical protein